MIPIGSPVSTIVTIHDMSLRLYPRCHPLRRLLLNRPLMHVAIREAASIVTVSDSARRDLLRLHGVPADRVSVVHEAASPAFRPIDDRAELERVRARYSCRRGLSCTSARLSRARTWRAWSRRLPTPARAAFRITWSVSGRMAGRRAICRAGSSVLA